jgi:hypothetical protein
MKKIKVYVAGPYTKGDVAVNVRNAFAAAEELAGHGFYPFVPHYSHFWHMFFPHPYPFWMDMDREWLLVCDAVLRIPGESSGADDEVDLARVRRIPVFTAKGGADGGLLYVRAPDGAGSLRRPPGGADVAVCQPAM